VVAIMFILNYNVEFYFYYNFNYNKLLSDLLVFLRSPSFLTPLNKYQINYIKNLSHEEKNDLFDIFNECVRIFNETM
jgi:hypothetical protein